MTIVEIKTKIIHNLIFLSAITILLLAQGCTGIKLPPSLECSTFEIQSFQLFLKPAKANNAGDSNCKTINLDYTNAINGFTIPSVKQAQDGLFHFHFSIKNKKSSTSKFLYRLYYQNESYKFPECSANDSAKQHEKSGENFYGTAMQTTTCFAYTSEIPADGRFHEVDGTFSITGNPRNEQKYFSGNVNDRWKRNPRVGTYRMMLVVSDESNLQKGLFPTYITDITKTKSGQFVNPFHFFLYGGGRAIPNIISQISEIRLRIIASPDLSSGVYISPADFPSPKSDTAFTMNCNNTTLLYKNAPVQQFIHYVDESSAFDNIPTLANVLNDEYSQVDYNYNRTFSKKSDRIHTKPSTADCPCRDIIPDTSTHRITIINPAATAQKLQKQDVGLITRHGLTYGTYTVKANLTRLLNKYHVWNGLTNALWLITQSNDAWNERSICEGKGYRPKYWSGEKDERAQTTTYSEIDFEILKTVPYCPDYAFPPAYLYPVANAKDSTQWNVPLPDEVNNGNITVSCTNWDMACTAPENYNAGCFPVPYKNEIFYAHRWDYWYRAITEKYDANERELFGSPYYYFQIEWTPTEIIWRIGPEKDKLKVVGYMNSGVTTIPDNQMLLIISQEFHNTDWWPGSPFDQRNIPFPSGETKGTIFEITVE
ncbi:MAG: hypothetical protein WCM76_09930 [Bacteroidota bacterium]